jgi:hypothetical protein
VVAYVGGRPIEVWRAPRPLDLAGSIRGQRHARFVAASDVECVGSPRDVLRGSELVEALADESALLWGRIEADAKRDDDTFLPFAVPVPGPWHFRSANAIVLVVQGDAAKLRASLPRGVRLLPGTKGRFLLAVTRFEGVGSLDSRDTSQFAYHEVTPFVPVWSGARGPGAFIPELYPDAWMAVILGREIHGFPKRTARVGFHEDGAELILDRRLALRVRFRERTSMAANDALASIVEAMTGSTLLARGSRKLLDRFSGRDLGFSALVHKRIAACQTAGRTLAIDDVVRVPVALAPIRRAYALRSLEVDLPGGPGVLYGSALAGFFLESGFRFGGGTVDRGRGSGR